MGLSGSSFRAAARALGLGLDNKDVDLNFRFLDRAEIQAVHEFRKEHKSPSYDTVRAAFGEGILRRMTLFLPNCYGHPSMRVD